MGDRLHVTDGPSDTPPDPPSSAASGSTKRPPGERPRAERPRGFQLPRIRGFAPGRARPKASGPKASERQATDPNAGSPQPPRPRRPRTGHTHDGRNRWIVALLAAAAVLLVVAIGSFIRFAATVDALRMRRAAGPAWSFPSRVYSDGVWFMAGRALPPAYLRAQREARDYRYR